VPDMITRRFSCDSEDTILCSVSGCVSSSPLCSVAAV
jgi:hypothetical protein